MVEEDLADHIDLNFGCPVPKVTRKGGGSALPYKRRLFESIVRTAVRTAAEADVPVTVKMRIGIDPEHITYTDAGRIAEDCGVAAVALHGRTAIQHYSGTADWDAIGTLKQLVTSIPVLGNGDIFAASDALEMMAADRLRRRRRRARLPGPAVAVRRTGGRLRGPTGADPAGPAGGGRHPAPARRTALRRDGSRPRHPRPAQTHRLVPQGVRRRVRSRGGCSAWCRAWTNSTPCWPGSTSTSRSRRPGTARAAGRGPRSGGSRCRYGWLDDPESEVVPEGAELDDGGG